MKLAVIHKKQNFLFSPSRNENSLTQPSYGISGYFKITDRDHFLLNKTLHLLCSCKTNLTSSQPSHQQILHARKMFFKMEM